MAGHFVTELDTLHRKSHNSPLFNPGPNSYLKITRIPSGPEFENFVGNANAAQWGFLTGARAPRIRRYNEQWDREMGYHSPKPSSLVEISAKHCVKWNISLFVDQPPATFFEVVWQHYKECRNLVLQSYDSARPFVKVALDLAMLKLNSCLKINHFSKLLRVRSRRMQLHTMFQFLNDKYKYDDSKYIGDFQTRELAPLSILKSEFDFFISKLFNESNMSKQIMTETLVNTCNLALFLHEAGWHQDAYEVMAIVNEKLSSRTRFIDIRILFQFFTRHAYICLAGADYGNAKLLIGHAQKLLYLCDDPDAKAVYFLTKTIYFLAYSKYDLAYRTCKKALAELTSSSDPYIIADVLRHVTKVCVVKRKFEVTRLVVKFAVNYVNRVLGPKDLKTADVLFEYAFYLLHLDFIVSAVEVHRRVLEIRRDHVFKSESNTLVANAHEDLAYSLYVQQYNTGRFKEAYQHAVIAMQQLKSLLDENHFFQSAAQRVLALIVEEMALEFNSRSDRLSFLADSEQLHWKSVDITIKYLGENNLQTAKHYGNLGRLYQSLSRFEEAETKHVKAIEIKEKLMGPDDYEISLSLGHLASLYNYDMNEYTQAEELYLRAIKIGETMFGHGYSGLEYDYKGLIRVYTVQRNFEAAAVIEAKLDTWRKLHTEQKERDLMNTLDVDMNLTMPSPDSPNACITTRTSSRCSCPILPSERLVQRNFDSFIQRFFQMNPLEEDSDPEENDHFVITEDLSASFGSPRGSSSASKNRYVAP